MLLNRFAIRSRNERNVPQAKLSELNEQLLLLRSRANAQLPSDKKQTRGLGSRSANKRGSSVNASSLEMMLHYKAVNQSCVYFSVNAALLGALYQPVS